MVNYHPSVMRYYCTATRSHSDDWGDRTWVRGYGSGSGGKIDPTPVPGRTSISTSLYEQGLSRAGGTDDNAGCSCDRLVSAYLPPCRVLLRWADRLDENRERRSVLNHPVDARDQSVVFPCLRDVSIGRHNIPYMLDPVCCVPIDCRTL